MKGSVYELAFSSNISRIRNGTRAYNHINIVFTSDKKSVDVQAGCELMNRTYVTMAQNGLVLIDLWSENSKYVFREFSSVVHYDFWVW